MSVDFYTCDHCSENFCECGPHIRCQDNCGSRWCSMECAEKDGFGYTIEDDEPSCSFCGGEDFDDQELLDFCLQKLRVTREDLVKELKAERERQQ